MTTDRVDSASGAPDDDDDLGGMAPNPRPDEHDRSPRRSRSSRVVVALAAVAGLAAIAAGLWGLDQRASGDQDLAEAREVAGRFGAAYLTFDAATVNEAGEELLALATERFAQEFEAARLPSVEALFAGSDTATVAEVSDVFTTAIDDERVRALVFVDIDATGPGGAQRLVNLSFILELAAIDGTWRVDAVAPVPFPEVVGGPGADGSSTTMPPAGTTASTAPPAAPTGDSPTGP